MKVMDSLGFEAEDEATVAQQETTSLLGFLIIQGWFFGGTQVSPEVERPELRYIRLDKSKQFPADWLEVWGKEVRLRKVREQWEQAQDRKRRIRQKQVVIPGWSVSGKTVEQEISAEEERRSGHILRVNKQAKKRQIVSGSTDNPAPAKRPRMSPQEEFDAYEIPEAAAEELEAALVEIRLEEEQRRQVEHDRLEDLFGQESGDEFGEVSPPTVVRPEARGQKGAKTRRGRLLGDQVARRTRNKKKSGQSRGTSSGTKRKRKSPSLSSQERENPSQENNLDHELRNKLPP